VKHTPEVITELKKDEVFVFGSNESGIHGAGAAKVARTNFGAQMSKGFGMSGKSFAIPTKDWDIKTLPLEVIKFYVDRFIAFAESNSSLTFLVTKIGCGLAGYSAADIGPLFANAPSNVVLPEEFTYNPLLWDNTPTKGTFDVLWIETNTNGERIVTKE
jgi:hypothetical protein